MTNKKCFSIFSVLGIVCLQYSVVMAQSRNWSLSKDTVLGLAIRADSVYFVNTGTDTLKIDSIALEMVKPITGYFHFDFFCQIPNSEPGLWPRASYSQYSQFWSGDSPKLIRVLPGQPIRMSGFQLKENIPVKRAAVSWIGDTLRLRLIFIAGAGRGRDSLLVTSLWSTTSISSLFPVPSLAAPVTRWFDPLGRRVDILPGVPKNPMTPILTPDE